MVINWGTLRITWRLWCHRGSPCPSVWSFIMLTLLNTCSQSLTIIFCLLLFYFCWFCLFSFCFSCMFVVVIFQQKAVVLSYWVCCSGVVHIHVVKLLWTTLEYPGWTWTEWAVANDFTEIDVMKWDVKLAVPAKVKLPPYQLSFGNRSNFDIWTRVYYRMRLAVFFVFVTK